MTSFQWPVFERTVHQGILLFSTWRVDMWPRWISTDSLSLWDYDSSKVTQGEKMVGCDCFSWQRLFEYFLLLTYLDLPDFKPRSLFSHQHPSDRFPFCLVSYMCFCCSWWCYPIRFKSITWFPTFLCLVSVGMNISSFRFVTGMDFPKD